MFSEVICPMHLPWALLSPDRMENKTLDTDTGWGLPPHPPPGANSLALRVRKKYEHL